MRLRPEQWPTAGPHLGHSQEALARRRSTFVWTCPCGQLSHSVTTTTAWRRRRSRMLGGVLGQQPGPAGPSGHPNDTARLAGSIAWRRASVGSRRYSSARWVMRWRPVGVHSLELPPVMFALFRFAPGQRDRPPPPADGRATFGRWPVAPPQRSRRKRTVHHQRPMRRARGQSPRSRLGQTPSLFRLSCARRTGRAERT